MLSPLRDRAIWKVRTEPVKDLWVMSQTKRARHFAKRLSWVEPFPTHTSYDSYSIAYALVVREQNRTACPLHLSFCHGNDVGKLQRHGDWNARAHTEKQRTRSKKPLSFGLPRTQHPVQSFDFCTSQITAFAKNIINIQLIFDHSLFFILILEACCFR